MKGVWGYLHGTTQAPSSLALALRCRQWNTLPYAGGYLNQPVHRMKLMELALEFYTAITGYMDAHKRLKPEEFIKWQREHKQAVELFNRAAKEA